jgi:hypothetical protein
MAMRLILLPVLVALGVLAGPATPARADLLTACSPEVRTYCADVRQGRGRITACLASHRDQLGSGCLPEVQATARRRTMPSQARRVLGPGFRADLPPACTVAAARYCPGVPAGDGRVFACLYARADRVDPKCTSAAKAVVGR